MTDKQLRKLSRRDLLELLLDNMEENEKLRAQLDEANEKLRNRDIAISSSGSIAEAALKLSGIFEAAEEAARLYVRNASRAAARSTSSDSSNEG